MTIFDNLLYPYVTPIDPQYATCEHCRAELWVHSNDFNSNELETSIADDDWPEAQVFNKTKSCSKYKGVYSVSSDKIVLSCDLREHIDWLCDLLENSNGLKKIQANKNTRLIIACFWWSKKGDGAPVLWPMQLKRLALLDMEFSIEYAYYGDDD